MTMTHGRGSGCSSILLAPLLFFRVEGLLLFRGPPQPILVDLNVGGGRNLWSFIAGKTVISE